MRSLEYPRQLKSRGPLLHIFRAALLLCAGSCVLGTTPSVAGETPAARQELERIAYAVDDAESSHGRNAGMWRPELAGPQGPMQISDKAAHDVGGGDRFDIAENRALGRAYLALLYRRYRNWPDAVSAYNWGMGNLDGWIRAGRPSQKLVPAVAAYQRRVLAESGLCASGRECTRAVMPYGPTAYRHASLAASNDLAIPGLEQSGRPLMRFVKSGTPLPKLAQSGEPTPALEQSGRPLSPVAASGRPRGAGR